MGIHKLAIGAAVAAGMALTTLTGCGAGLSGSSTCNDYLSAPESAQHKVAAKLAAQYHTPDFVTPMGFPEIAYDCANNPSATLDKLFTAYAKG